MPVTIERVPAVSWLSDNLSPFTLLLAVLLLALLAFTLFLLVHWLIQRLLPWLGVIDDQLRPYRLELSRWWPEHRWRWLRRHMLGDLVELLTLLAAGSLLWLATAVLFEMIEAVVEAETLVAVDIAVHGMLQTLRTDPMDRAMVMITELGGAWVTVPVIAAVTLRLAWSRHWVALSYWLGAAVAARLSVMLLKWAIARQRPGTIYSGVEQFSFPSGHATTAMILYGFLAFLLGNGLRYGARLAVYAGAVALIAAVGLSRLYLGVHWLSDVGAGFALGFAWVTLLAVAFVRLHPHQSPRPAPLTLAVLAALIVAVAVRYGWYLGDTVDRYQSLGG